MLKLKCGSCPVCISQHADLGAVAAPSEGELVTAISCLTHSLITTRAAPAAPTDCEYSKPRMIARTTSIFIWDYPKIDTVRELPDMMPAKCFDF